MASGGHCCKVSHHGSSGPARQHRADPCTSAAWGPDLPAADPACAACCSLQEPRDAHTGVQMKDMGKPVPLRRLSPWPAAAVGQPCWEASLGMEA